MRREVVAFQLRSPHKHALLSLIVCAFVSSTTVSANAGSPAKSRSPGDNQSRTQADFVSVKTKKALLRAEELEALGEYSQAIVLFNSAVQENPNNANLYERRGKCYLNLNELDKAIADLNRVIKLAPESPGNPYLHRGRCYQKLNEHSKAIADFTSGIDSEEHGRKKQTKFFSLYMARGRSYELLGQYAKAMKDYNRCLEYKGGTTDSGTVKMWRNKLYKKMEQSQN